MDSKFVFDLLSKELFKGDHDLKFVSWDDLDAALATDTNFKAKLEVIAKEKKIEELMKLVGENSDDDVTFIETPSNEPSRFYQKFIPYDANNKGAGNNEAFFYSVEKRG
jgi:peptide subunit release factor 1 (eRF1)